VVTTFNEHTEKNHLLPSRQSAYRVNHSTETAVMAIYDFIVRAIDSGEVCAIVLLDLSSAFDTVDHDTLLRVLTHRFGVTGPALIWFSSYLTGRTPAYHHNDQRSQSNAVNCSVPQLRQCSGTPRIRRLYGRAGKTDRRIPSQPSPVRWWYAAAEENTNQWHRIHHWSTAAVHRGHSRMMFIQNVYS